ncbi:MAG: hypothetical protein PVF58_22880, partial [Candidatus Methanofastidiosia archaeon]
MRKIVYVILFVFLLVLSTCGGLYGQEKPRVLFDEYHAVWDPEQRYVDFISELETNGYIVDFSHGKIESSLLSSYDTLVLSIPFRYFHEDEKNAIKEFVKNGGGLIIFGERGGWMEYKGISTAVNSISTIFGIEFNIDQVEDEEKNRSGKEWHPVFTECKHHPVTRGITSIAYISGCSLNLQSSATALIYGNSSTVANGQKGKEVIILAAAEYGNGKVLVMGDTDFLVGENTEGYDTDYLSLRDNKKLGLNMVEWVTPE